MRQRRLTRRLRHKQRRVKRSKGKTFRQGGGGPKPLLEESTNAPAITVQGPKVDFNVRFQPSVKAREDGPTFTTYQTAHEPYPVWTAPTPPTMYTIFCWDPDATTKSFLHWLIVNCTQADNSGGKILAPWSPPSPPPGSGEHRYVLGLFAQTKPIDIPAITDRTNFNPPNFATQNGLTPLAYTGFRVVAADTPPPPQANPQNAPPPPPNSVPAIPPLQNNKPAV
jgi:phosphatidylethanolamine-binding protein (PEBP) family uncharacterized protein